MPVKHYLYSVLQAFYFSQMLTIQNIREQKETIIERLKIKNFNRTKIVEEILATDDERRSLQVRTNELQAEMNQLSKEIGILFKKGEKEQADQIRARTSKLKKELESYEDKFRAAGEHLNELLVQVPNLPHVSVPPGKSSADNRVVREGGNLPRIV
jgi:seryl-tRNA synthetase